MLEVHAFLLIALLLSCVWVPTCSDHHHNSNIYNHTNTTPNNHSVHSNNIHSNTTATTPSSTQHDTTHNIGIASTTQSWHSLATVDGLHNEEVVVLVSSSGMKQGDLLSERILPSARTWMKSFAHVFVLLEDTFLLRFTLRHCIIHDTDMYTVFDCHQEPSYLLIRDCGSSEYGAAGPGCKLDAALQFVYRDLPVLYNLKTAIKFVLHTNDVTFLRPDQMLRYLAAVNRAGLDDFPLIGNPFRSDSKLLLPRLWHISGCEEIRTSGWYQPMLLNHAALAKLQTVVEQKGIAATCHNFDLNVDIAMEVIAWMLELVHISIPHVELNERFQGKAILDGNQMVLGNVNHDRGDLCSPGNEDKWPAQLRYQQEVIVGCGNVNTSSPFHDANRLVDMYDAWRYFQQHGKPLQFGRVGKDDWVEVLAEKYLADDGKLRIKHILSPNTKLRSTHSNASMVSKAVIPKLTPLRGYHKSKHGQLHHHMWHEMKLKDCTNPGKVLFAGESSEYSMSLWELWTRFEVWILLAVGLGCMLWAIRRSVTDSSSELC